MITSEVAAALDRTNTFYRKAPQIFSATASSGQLQHDPDDVVISPSATRRSRMKHREALIKCRCEYSLRPLTADDIALE